MVQHQLDQMIRDTTEQSYRCRMTEVTAAASKGTTMVVVEKCSEDPRQDFVDSVATMITANKLQNPNNLRALLDYYMSVNPQELHVMILDAFYQVCTDMFSSSKCYSYSADF
ncbi:unnamed protein product [Linum tenue]|uniref:Transcription repressor n=1 Tax=Linum tenue TaxID=586396 RepID=A0AAV0PAS6_9ROSI|nr:unnamed protein product [Linum tenue]